MGNCFEQQNEAQILMFLLYLIKEFFFVVLSHLKLLLWSKLTGKFIDKFRIG